MYGLPRVTSESALSDFCFRKHALYFVLYLSTPLCFLSLHMFYFSHMIFNVYPRGIKSIFYEKKSEFNLHFSAELTESKTLIGPCAAAALLVS